MKLFRTKIFKKDYQKLKITDTQYSKYINFLSMLLDDKDLPLEARDHNLVGNFSGFRESHVGGDLLVIYCIEDDILRLTRIGPHSKLFK
jgi:mRNA interferase YafQ